VAAAPARRLPDRPPVGGGEPVAGLIITGASPAGPSDYDSPPTGATWREETFHA